MHVGGVGFRTCGGGLVKVGEIPPTRGSALSKIHLSQKAVAGFICLSVVLCALLTRYLPFANRLVLTVAALFPYLAIAAPVSLVLFVLDRRWLLTGAAAAVTAAAIATQVPLFVASTAPASGVDLRVMSVNLRFGTAHADRLVNEATTQAEVLAVQELTPDALARLSVAGVDSEFPFRVVDARFGTAGVGVWSKYPITESSVIGGYLDPLPSIRIRVPNVVVDPTLLVVHLHNPWHIDDWTHDMNRLPTTFREADERAGGGAVIVAGDFNATLDMRPFRDLLQGGYHDAAEQAGAGFTPTFLGGRVPPMFAIDHILTLRSTAVAVDTVIVPGTDHRAIVATVTLPR